MYLLYKMNNTLLIVGVVGVIGGVGYYMYLQAKNVPQHYKYTPEQREKLAVEEHDKREKEEQDRIAEETRQRVCKLKTINDVREMFLWRDGKISDMLEREINAWSLSPTALNEFITTSQKQAGGCDF
jgi:hypothetical protein